MADITRNYYFTLWPAGPVLRVTFVQYLIAFCSRPQVMSDVITGRFYVELDPDSLHVTTGVLRKNRKVVIVG